MLKKSAVSTTIGENSTKPIMDVEGTSPFSKNKKSAVTKSVATKSIEPPSRKKIISMLSASGVTKQKICAQLALGLVAKKSIVVDGEIFEVDDFPTRHKFIETILDVLGEKKLQIPEGDLHIHFTNILQHIRAYERGDTRSVKDAEKFIEASGGDIGEAGPLAD